MSSARPVSSTARLRKDYMRLKRDPVPYISAEPLPDNILEWHYCVRGPEDTPYHGGFYHGWLVFPFEFPFKPPAIYMRTPSGRFKTNTRLCLSISDFHPDTWNPAWSVATILTGLLSFMLEPTPTLGSTEASAAERRHLAQASLRFNLDSAQFCGLFPTEAAVMRRTLRRLEPPAANGAADESSRRTNPDSDDDDNDEYDDVDVEDVGSEAAHDRRGHSAANRRRKPALATTAGAGAAAALNPAAAAAAAAKPVQRGRERRERQRAEKAALAAANTATVDGFGAEHHHREGTTMTSSNTAAEDWRTVGANVAVLVAFAVFVALVVHVIRSLGDD